MFAVIESGGKQYKVTEGQTLLVDLFDVPENKKVTFEKVLLVSNGDSVSIGQPVVESAVVKAEFVAIEKGKKIEVFKMKRRKDSRVHTGHRQKYCSVKILKIDTSAKKTKVVAEAVEVPEKKETAKTKETPKTKTVKKETVKAKETPKAKPVKKETVKAKEAPKAKTVKKEPKKAEKKSDE